MHYHELEATIYDRVYASVREDIPYWQALAKEYCGADGAALELACGTARVLLPVAAAGVRVTGIDESPSMLKLARKKVGKAPADVRARTELVQEDMRSFDLGHKFNLIYIPFNTLALLLTIEDQLAALAAIKKHLAPGGVFAFDVFVPDVNRLANPVVLNWSLEMDETFDDGSRVQRDLMREVDTRRQILNITWRNKEYKDQILIREWLSEIKLSYFFPRELENLVARAGFEIVHYWGDYARHDFWDMAQPWKQLMVVR